MIKSTEGKLFNMGMAYRLRRSAPKFYPWMHGADMLKDVGAMYPHWNAALCAQYAKQWDVPLFKPFGKRSPGERQKIAILTALGNEPDLLILDEPVSSLDPQARRAFLRSLLEIASDEDHTILFSTHITSDVERVATHVAFLHDGRIQWFDELDVTKERVATESMLNRRPINLRSKCTVVTSTIRVRFDSRD